MLQAYEITGIKNFKGHDSDSYSKGVLSLAGKKVATWSENPFNGPMDVDFVSEKAEAEFVPFARDYLSKIVDMVGRPCELATMEDEHVAYEAVQRMVFPAIENHTMAKLCQTHIVVKVQSSHPGAAPVTQTAKTLYTESNVAELRQRFPGIVEVVNERFGPPMKEGTPEHLKAEAEQYKSQCKKKTLFVRPAKGILGVFFLDAPYSPKVAAHLRAKYPDLVRIINEGALPAKEAAGAAL